RAGEPRRERLRLRRATAGQPAEVCRGCLAGDGAAAPQQGNQLSAKELIVEFRGRAISIAPPEYALASPALGQGSSSYEGRCTGETVGSHKRPRADLGRYPGPARAHSQAGCRRRGFQADPGPGASASREG